MKQKWYEGTIRRCKCETCKRHSWFSLLFWKKVGEISGDCVLQQGTISLPRKPVVIGLWLVVIGLLIANVIMK